MSQEQQQLSGANNNAASPSRPTALPSPGYISSSSPPGGCSPYRSLLSRQGMVTENPSLSSRYSSPWRPTTEINLGGTSSAAVEAAAPLVAPFQAFFSESPRTRACSEGRHVQQSRPLGKSAGPLVVNTSQEESEVPFPPPNPLPSSHHRPKQSRILGVTTRSTMQHAITSAVSCEAPATPSFAPFLGGGIPQRATPSPVRHPLLTKPRITPSSALGAAASSIEECDGARTSSEESVCSAATSQNSIPVTPTLAVVRRNLGSPFQVPPPSTGLVEVPPTKPRSTPTTPPFFRKSSSAISGDDAEQQRVSIAPLYTRQHNVASLGTAELIKAATPRATS
jgi:hypothetical protein